jgi:hypothetical protein
MDLGFGGLLVIFSVVLSHFQPHGPILGTRASRAAGRPFSMLCHACASFPSPQAGTAWPMSTRAIASRAGLGTWTP